MSTDGITPIGNENKRPSFKIKMKGKEYKELNRLLKEKRFEFGIIPAEINGSNTVFDRIKRGRDGSISFIPSLYDSAVCLRILIVIYPD